MEALISVLVPVYNMEALLRRCVDSLLAQDYPSVEIILLDDGSTDTSLAICQEYAAADARVKAYHQPNRGISAARNALTAYAQGEYFSFVDADDWVEPRYLSVLYGLCQTYNTRLAACNHTIICGERASARFSEEGQSRVLTLREACHGVLYHGVPDVSPWGKLYYRSLASAIAYPEGRLYEDTYCIADVLIAADGLAYTPVPLYNYWLRADSISRDSFRESKMDFVWAADRLAEVVSARFPELARGAARRRVHALLSVRRYFVDCGAELRPRRDELERRIRAGMRGVLTDPEAPRRDKLAVCAVRLGPRVYDALWKAYSKRRKQF